MSISMAEVKIEPFKIAVPQSQIVWVSERLRRTQWPHTLGNRGWKYGPDAMKFRALVDYWREDYDWRTQETHMNRLPQFTAMIAGRRLHFVHMRSTNPKATPLLLLHGWPNTFYSFDKVVEPLAAPERFGGNIEQGCHVIIPSLPGYTFSEVYDDQVRGPRFISKHIYSLMSEVLGYSRFIVEGGDWGAAIADWLAVDHPEAVIAEHANVFVLGRQVSDSDSTSEERAFADEDAAIHRLEGAYHELQTTRPESIAYAMTDSPVGAAAYLLDKWQKWCDTRSVEVETLIGRDHLLTEIMLYVVTDTCATSTWIYPGFALEPSSVPSGGKITVPYGFTGYPDPLGALPPRHLVERVRNLVSWEIKATGGHFPYLEDPGGYVESLRNFVALCS